MYLMRQKIVFRSTVRVYELNSTLTDHCLLSCIHAYILEINERVIYICTKANSRKLSLPLFCFVSLCFARVITFMDMFHLLRFRMLFVVILLTWILVAASEDLYCDAHCLWKCVLIVFNSNHSVIWFMALMAFFTLYVTMDFFPVVSSKIWLTILCHNNNLQ